MATSSIVICESTFKKRMNIIRKIPKKTCKSTHTKHNITNHEMDPTQLDAIIQEYHSAGFIWYQE
jgi:hypothetical protein